MMNSEDVRRVTFDRAMRGYRCEDVDDFLKQAADSMDAMRAENDDLQKKLVVLAQRIDQYRAEEDTLHTTLINAQRLGENVIKEAKQKAAEILRAANIKAEDSEQRARDEVELSKQELTTLKKEAGDFKKTLLSLYRKHIELISGLPEYSDGMAPSEASIPVEQPAAPLRQEPEPLPQGSLEPMEEQQLYDEQPPVEEEIPAAMPEVTSQGKVDTVEFAIAPKEDAPVAEPERVNPFSPGAGLYDMPEEDPKPVRSTAKKPARRSKKVQTQDASAGLPESFDSFSGVDFDS